jgi:hypothetical protein
MRPNLVALKNRPFCTPTRLTYPNVHNALTTLTWQIIREKLTFFPCVLWFLVDKVALFFLMYDRNYPSSPAWGRSQADPTS